MPTIIRTSTKNRAPAKVAPNVMDHISRMAEISVYKTKRYGMAAVRLSCLVTIFSTPIAACQLLKVVLG